MKKNQRNKGQTVIETALMMILLLVLFFGIAEIARAWWLKNMLNNAARVGVRVAIVTLPVDLPSGSATCSSSNDVVTAACNSITNAALHDDPSTRVSLTTTDNNVNGTVDAGDTVTVTVQGTFRSVVPNLAALSFGLFPGQLPMQTSASMRYE